LQSEFKSMLRMGETFRDLVVALNHHVFEFANRGDVQLRHKSWIRQSLIEMGFDGIAQSDLKINSMKRMIWIELEAQRYLVLSSHWNDGDHFEFGELGRSQFRQI
jgi:hypothetical protein